MHTLKLLSLITLVFLIHCTSKAQTEYMINGGFEYVDNSIPLIPPYVPTSAPIYWAVPWNNIENSCDVHHATAAPIIGTPRTGDGNGRFVAPANGAQNEFCYGVTDPLVAGETYIVSFWIRKDFSEDRDVLIGTIISESIPVIQASPFTTTHSPNMTMTPTSTQYVEGSFCFTAQNSVTHYVSFGPWTPGGSVTVGYYIDDVSVKTLAPGTLLPVADVSIPQTNYCFGDDVLVDGSLTTNESGYVWEVYSLVNGNPSIQKYTSGIQSGQAGTFNVSNVLNFAQPGDCYRVILKALGTCEDEAYVDFCFIDPSIDFIYDGDPVCEGDLVNLQVTGENGWTYTWYEGSAATGTTLYSGTGIQSASVAPTIGNATYTVVVTTPEGCTSTETLTLAVHSQNNVAPWCDGVYNGGDFTVYVQQGGSAYFWSNIGNDNANEIILTTDDFSGIPPFSSFNYTPPSNGGVWDFSITTNNSTPTGLYSFTLTANDQNACSEGISTFIFTIVVICDQCPICVTYEDRGPTPQMPLPSETLAGQCIRAGFNAPVSTGTANVYFQAGQSIELGPFWTAGPGYQGVIDPSTCVTDCESCCEDWTGFTYDPVQNYMNFEDGNPQTSIWQLTDVNHPFCAFNAQGYTLDILNQYQNTMYSSGYTTTACCPFESPSPENPITYSSIWWDGYTENIFGNPVHPENGTYYYLVTLYGCGGATHTLQGFITILGSSGLILHEDSILTENKSVDGVTTAQEEEALRIQHLLEEITLVPNPASDQVKITGATEIHAVHLLNESGAVLEKVHLNADRTIDVSRLASGKYFVKLFVEQSYLVKELIKL